MDPEPIPNRLNCDADTTWSSIKNLPSLDWPLSHCAYGGDFLVPLSSSVNKSTMRREIGIRLPPVQLLAGLVDVDASLLVPSADNAHAARGRGIELVLWQGVFCSERSKFGVRIGTGQMVRRKNATAAEPHQPSAWRRCRATPAAQ